MWSPECRNNPLRIILYMLKTSDFDYDLPKKCIAQEPIEPRDSSRLLVLHRDSGEIQHSQFKEISKFLQPGDLLVINTTRVIPARLFAQKISTGGRIELLLLRKEDQMSWEVLVGGKGLKPGTLVQVEAGPQAEIQADLGGSRRIIRFNTPIEEVLYEIGHVPLPPYIHKPINNPGRYQTVYALHSGSAAAPTAGLHFTEELVGSLSSLGINFAEITLHIGLDTFAPVTEDDPLKHTIHTEWFRINETAAAQINQAHAERRRIIAVGTTSVRALESASRYATKPDIVASMEGMTNLLILPGYKFKVVDVMVTNFHLPRSTLIMLVSAFASREMILDCYRIAIEQGYKFYSFGDAMLVT
jgi:S-adenosylmethionine:tRNA ribosyltransferase-isomerase